MTDSILIMLIGLNLFFVFLGKTLKNAEDILTDIGVKDGATIMLLGKKVQ